MSQDVKWPGSRRATVRCPFCLTLNRVDLGRAADRPKCGECARPLLLDRPIKVTDEDFDRVIGVLFDKSEIQHVGGCCIMILPIFQTTD